MLCINRPERTLDTDDSVVGVGARKRRVDVEARERFWIFCERNRRVPVASEKPRRADDLRRVFVNAAALVANAPPTTGGIALTSRL